MTNGEKLKEIFPNIKVVAIVPNEVVIIKKLDDMATYSNNSFSYKWWNAEYIEPTTKNDLGVECIDKSTECKHKCIDNDLRVDCNNCKNNFHRGDGISYCTTGDGMCHYECEEDCISRADAIKAMQDKAKKLTNEDTINGLCGAVAILFDLPSVTPQEPKTGHWLMPDKEYSSKIWRKCSCCGTHIEKYSKHISFDGEVHYMPYRLNYCYVCGAKMESEK